MKIAVTGATGLIGKPLIRHLLARGHEVVALGRDAARVRERLPYPCETAEWPASDGRQPEWLAGVEAVVHLAGEPVAQGHWTAAKKKRILESRELTTRSIVELIAKARDSGLARVGTLVSASAIGIYGNRGDETLDEASSLGTGFLADVCRAWEAAVCSAEATRALAGVRVANVRIGVVLSADGGAFEELRPIFKAGLGGRVGSGRQWLSWIHIDDVVALLAQAVEDPRCRGVLNATAPAPATNRDFSRELAAALGRPCVMPVPAVGLKAALGEKASIVLEGQRVVPAQALALGFQYRFPELKTALLDLVAQSKADLRTEQWVPGALSEVRAFFSNPRNLARLTPPEVGFELVGQSTPVLGEGTLIDYKMRVGGMLVRWQSRIESWVERDATGGFCFVDVQTRGPFSRWEHLHRFSPLRNGTLIEDRLSYDVPAGPVGALLAGGLVRHRLERVFEHRRKVLEELWMPDVS